MKLHKRHFSLSVLLALTMVAGSTLACTNFLFTAGATKDGSTMITYAADSHTLYGELYYRKAADYPAGTMFMLYDWDSGKPLFEIPQVEHTYNVVGNMNEYQLAIGETTYGGREECWNTPVKGIDYGSLIYVTLQRAKTAREAIKVMTELVEKYGYCSEGESFSICDPDEVWILEMIGKRAEYDTVKGKPVMKKQYKGYKDGAVWVARRIPNGYVSGHANQARITTFPLETRGSKTSISSRNMKDIFVREVECVYAADVISFARMRGWFNGKDEEFSFADTYCPLTFSGIRGCDARVYAMFNRINSGMQKYEKYAMGDPKAERLPLWIKPDNKVSLHEVMNLMRDHYEGTAMDMTKDVGAGPFACPYRWRPMNWELDGKKYVHERATSTQQTGFSFVAQCRGYIANRLMGGILWFGVDDTYSTCYCPMYCGLTEIPECFRQGNGSMTEYSETAAFWLFNRVTNFCYSRYSDMIVDVQREQNRLEEKFIRDVAHIDHKFDNLSNGKLQKELNNVSREAALEMMHAWRNLDHYLLVKYIDGNIKEEVNGRFKTTETGASAFPKQPKYPTWFYRQIVEDHGSVIKEKF